MTHSPRILKLDASGTPNKWVTYEEVAFHHAKGNILWTLGDLMTLRGGHNNEGIQSTLDVPSIMAVRGRMKMRQRSIIPLEKQSLFRRDRHTCAYCGNVFHEDQLRMEHIYPHARGGKLVWSNIVSACEPCNSRKACRTPEEARMPLLYVPYVPDAFEGFILTNRRILADQMEFLMAGVAKHSRLLL